MSITPEQFKGIIKDVVSEEMHSLKEEMRGQFRQVFDALDVVTKKSETVEIEMLSNVAAHDRFEERISVLENAKA